jgi:hypothetical protein
VRNSKTKKPLEDGQYDEQVERMSGLPKFPQIPTAQKELRRALRRISDTDITFIRKLIDEVVDTASACPTPSELIQMAGAKRHRTYTSVGKADCDTCHGSGFVTTMRNVALPGLEPYEAEFATPCQCRGGKS